jgi:lipopolysaccharide transport system ATP-binding protein
VASLLEVGTGFHPELTGRENIFLNGAILGMTRAEIRKKFDEIVAFAEVEKFLDTPVKHYSSGMYVRLAFAVAAHLEPEILVVDEVLAVGKKCLGKMSKVAQAGRTILFVSHNMAAVRQLCPTTIRLQNGGLHHEGMSEDVVDQYLRESLTLDAGTDICGMIRDLPRDPVFKLLDVSITQDGKSPTALLNGRPTDVAIRYRVLEKTHGLRVYVDLCDENQYLLIRSFDDEMENPPRTKVPGEYVSVARIPADILAPGEYCLLVQATIHNVRNLTGNGLPIRLKVGQSSRINSGYPHEPIRGRLLPPMRWTNRILGDAHV